MMVKAKKRRKKRTHKVKTLRFIFRGMTRD